MIRVMVVEDEPHILRSIKRMIESLHPRFEVVATAYNGEEAIKLLPTAAPDILFTDINMPMLDGLDLLAYVKKQGLDIEPIIISGYQEFEYARKALSLGVNEYLLKPISRKDLSDLLDQLFIKHERSQKRKELKYLGSLLLQHPASEPLPSPLSLNHRSLAVLLLCSGSFPSHSTVDDSLRHNSWFELDLEKACGDLWVNEDNRAWVLDGKSEAEKFIVLAGGVVDRFASELALFVSGLTRFLSSKKLPITTVVSPVIDHARDIEMMGKRVRSTMAKQIRIGYPQTLQVSELQALPPEPYPGLDSSTERKLNVAMEQGNLQLFKLVIGQIVER